LHVTLKAYSGKEKMDLKLVPICDVCLTFETPVLVVFPQFCIHDTVQNLTFLTLCSAFAVKGLNTHKPNFRKFIPIVL
jgi:hypothetical protein